MKKNKNITKKEINETFKKLNIKKQSSEEINDWIEMLWRNYLIKCQKKRKRK